MSCNVANAQFSNLCRAEKLLQLGAPREKIKVTKISMMVRQIQMTDQIRQATNYRKLDAIT